MASWCAFPSNPTTHSNLCDPARDRPDRPRPSGIASRGLSAVEPADRRPSSERHLFCTFNHDKTTLFIHGGCGLLPDRGTPTEGNHHDALHRCVSRRRTTGRRRGERRPGPRARRPYVASRSPPRSSRLDEWCKVVSPSTALRQWVRPRSVALRGVRSTWPGRTSGTATRRALQHLRALAQIGPLPLITATKRADISEARALATILRD